MSMRQMLYQRHLPIPRLIQQNLLQPPPSTRRTLPIRPSTIPHAINQRAILPSQRHPRLFPISIRSRSDDAVSRTWNARGDGPNGVEEKYSFRFVLQEELGGVGGRVSHGGGGAVLDFASGVFALFYFVVVHVRVVVVVILVVIVLLVVVDISLGMFVRVIVMSIK